MDVVELEEFDSRLREFRASDPAAESLNEYSPFDGMLASEADLAEAEIALGCRLPPCYRDFMRRHGGGMFYFLDLVPVVSRDKRLENLVELNTREYPAGDFIAVAPVGTGDYWGFEVHAGTCDEAVVMRYHDAPGAGWAADDFLEFVVRHGLTA